MQITIATMTDLITVQVAVVRSDLERTVADTEVGWGPGEGVGWEGSPGNSQKQTEEMKEKRLK